MNSILLRKIHPRGLLSFGPNTGEIELRSLNVLIGPNAAGKSNLIETLSLMRSCPIDIWNVVRAGGGIAEWLWKGSQRPLATIDLIFANPQGRQPLRHTVSLSGDSNGFRLGDEQIENEAAYLDQDDTYFYYRFQNGTPVLNTLSKEGRKLSRESIDLNQSILAQIRDPEECPELKYIADAYGRFRIYRNWSFGRNAVFREPQKADMRNDRLEEDFSNLGLFLNRLRRTPRAKKAIIDGLRDLYEGVTDFDVSIEGGSVQVFFTEGDFTLPATRLSDGTLRYLCLLAILCDPDPAPLVCIEEPELGLHPDILPKLADLLIEASSRMQLIVTTHSDILVDAMTERPESVLICEKHDRQTQISRLDSECLTAWLAKYRLGQLWLRGELGGTRW